MRKTLLTLLGLTLATAAWATLPVLGPPGYYWQCSQLPPMECQVGMTTQCWDGTALRSCTCVQSTFIRPVWRCTL
jgi:hypothetical protein